MDHAVFSGASALTYASLRAPARLLSSIQNASGALRSIPREDLSPAGLWMEDHARFLLGEADALRRALKNAPRLPGGHREPRILSLARLICREGKGEISAPLILRTARHFFADAEITQAELHYLSSALAVALFEKLAPVFSACQEEKRRLLSARKWIRDLEEGHHPTLPGDVMLTEKIIALLSVAEHAQGLQFIDEMLMQKGSSTEKITQEAHEKMTEMGEEAAKGITSLRRLSRLPFDKIHERLSPLAYIFREEETYRQMDEESRRCYQNRAAQLARRFHVQETAVARAAMALKKNQEGAPGEAGYYLLERSDLIAAYLLKRKPVPRNERVRERFFLLPLYLGAFLALLISLSLHAPLWLIPSILLAVSECLRIPYYRLLRRHFPARMLPRLKIDRLSKDQRTLVAVPTLLTSRKQAVQMIRQLSVLRCANPDPNLEFMLLADFADSPAEKDPQDNEIIQSAAAAIHALSQKKGGGFFYLHRERAWDKGQQRFSGRERKRGALESLNQLLTQGACQDAFCYSSCDPSSLKNRYAYVITLDADTFLPPGAAHKLIGAMAHPLQKGRIGIIQPRMEVSADTVRTNTQRLLGGQGGVDPYNQATQDIYQDVFCRGSFVGKGIYEPNLWMARLEGRLPAGRLLSHDLIEGEITQSALASDIVLYDGHPGKLTGWQKRLHRWTRGDWQLLPFLKDQKLSLLSRHKIWDNMRRSLLPAAQVILLLAAALLGNPFLCLLGLPWPIRGMGIRLMMLPAKALTLLDAMFRALYRLLISKRELLSWVTAAQAEAGGQLPLSCTLSQLIAGTAMIFFSLLPGGFLPLVFAGLAWVLSPLFAQQADAPIRGELKFTPRQREEVRALARDTWRFFEDTVTKEHHFLPPDNVQTEPDKGAALRTSPTNIGLYLLSCAAARELGFITTKALCQRFSDTLSALEKMDTWQGHPYNWYSLESCQPLAPAFISTVDSGNLAGCLMACAQICRMRLSEMSEEDQNLPARFDAFLERMDFSALYDHGERLFYIGWDVSAARPTPAHYDLMASEARLTSFIAVMRGQVPLSHWKKLGRHVIRAGGGPSLLSWGGTMFEYLMPALLLPLTRGSLLGEGCMNAIRAQMSAHPSRPFGISESGYYAFDPDLNYQYRAFGLPKLSLSGETHGQVIAPYASMLALPFFPRAAADNLLRMKKLGWADRHGLYEAADYSPQRVEKTPRLVMSHMAHHQGMILCAACNALTDNALVRAFMSPPPARAYAHLLLEKAPRRIHRRPELPPPREEASSFHSFGRTPRFTLPLDAHALHGSGMTWVLSAHGQGYLSYQGMMITRFFKEAGMPSGPQFYLRDEKTKESVLPAQWGNARFEAGSVSYTLDFSSLHCTLRHWISPLTGAAMTAVQMENPTQEEKSVEVISFLEIAQSPQAADEAHPNFRDLSVLIEKWGGSGLISRRLPRDEKDEMPLIGHGVIGETAALRRQGDRTLFLGRMGSYLAPHQLSEDAANCQYRLGSVIAPCLSLRVKLQIRPGKNSTLFFITAARKTEEELNALLLSPDALHASFSLAATQARMALRFLGIDGRMLSYYQQMLGALCFLGQPHQAVSSTAPRNALWRIGVAGVLPVLFIHIHQGADKALIRHVLRAHSWMRMQGIWVDCIFFCQESGGYQRPDRDTVSQLVAASPARDLIGKDGGVHLASGTEKEAKETAALAQLVLQGHLPLNAQLSALRTGLPEKSNAALHIPFPVAPPPLHLNNSFGGFTQEGAYAVYAPAPVPWHNLLCNPHFGTLVSDSGILQSYSENCRLKRITRFSPDVHRHFASEEIFLQDEAGIFYPLARPTAIHEPGVTAYHTLAGNISADLHLFAHAELPLGVRWLTLRGNEPQKIRLYYLVRFAMGEHPETTRCQTEGHFIYAKCGDMEGLAWAALKGATAQCLSPAMLFGLMGDSLPPGLVSAAQNHGSAALFSLELVLQPHDPASLSMVLGYGENEEAAKAHFTVLQEEGGGHALRRVRADWAKKLSGLTLFSGDPPLEWMLNRWLPCQTRMARLMARMGPYQSGGAYGFRDQLQDLLILLHTDAHAARNHLLLCAAHQFPEGDVQHWWHAPARGVRTRISDDKLFLPYMAALYVQITGDREILSAPAPYLFSVPLEKGEDDRYENPPFTPWEEPLLQHCIRAIDSVSLGIHGLPLMGSGDWNDGMNRVGGESGESVWLGFFLALVLREFAPLCPQETKEKYQQMRRKLLADAEHAWTGKWYLRAWYDTGEALGGPDTDPPRIDLISQSFAVLAGAPRDHARTALSHAVQLLYDREHQLVRLMNPPFSVQEQAGYIGAYAPGIRENGGQYTHAVPWLVIALCNLGEYALAWEIARGLLPANRSDTREKALLYKVEPYVLPGDIYTEENIGRGGWTWYTGSAAWLYYTLITVLLGFEKRGDRARLTPCPEPGMEEYTLIYRYHNTSYHFTAARDAVFSTLDGEKLPDGWVTLQNDGRTHEARFPLRK